MDCAASLQQIRQSTGALISFADLALQHTSGERRERLMGPIRQQMLEYARLQQTVLQGEQVLAQVKDEMANAMLSGQPVDLDEVVPRVRGITKQRVADSDLKAYDRYQELLQREQTGDEELVLTEAHSTTLDPWSKKVIQDPFRNIICGHIYDRSSLVVILREKSRKLCPYLGCTNKTALRREDLIGEGQGDNSTRLAL